MTDSDRQPDERAAALDPAYVEARRVLLDALFALAPHGSAFIVAGAQAVYLRSGQPDLAIAPYTTDGDLVLNPTLLAAEPQLERAMESAGFDLWVAPNGHPEPGIWVTPSEVEGIEDAIPIDLIVPEGAAAAGGRRAARLGPPHGKLAARRVRGLEAALVDHSPMKVAALDPVDSRTIEVEVAGSAALLVAKAHKLNDRIQAGRGDRLDDKDASDVVRLMQTSRPGDVGATLRELTDHPIAGEPSQAALGYVERLFGRGAGEGITMAARSLRSVMPRQRLEELAVAYTRELLRAASA